MVSISVKCRRARASPLAASTASRRMIACAIDTVTVRSPSRTGIRRDASSSTICVSRSGGCAGALDVAPFRAAARIAGLAWREAMRLGRVTVPDGRVARPAGAAHGATAWPSAAAAPLGLQPRGVVLGIGFPAREDAVTIDGVDFAQARPAASLFPRRSGSSQIRRTHRARSRPGPRRRGGRPRSVAPA